MKKAIFLVLMSLVLVMHATSKEHPNQSFTFRTNPVDKSFFRFQVLDNPSHILFLFRIDNKYITQTDEYNCFSGKPEDQIEYTLSKSRLVEIPKGQHCLEFISPFNKQITTITLSFEAQKTYILTFKDGQYSVKTETGEDVDFIQKPGEVLENPTEGEPYATLVDTNKPRNNGVTFCIKRIDNKHCNRDNWKNTNDPFFAYYKESYNIQITPGEHTIDCSLRYGTSESIHTLSITHNFEAGKKYKLAMTNYEGNIYGETADIAIVEVP